jgi:hypothetical protein
MTSDPIPSCDIQTCLRGLCILHFISGVTKFIGLETESWIYSGQWRELLLWLLWWEPRFFQTSSLKTKWETRTPIQTDSIYVKLTSLCNVEMYSLSDSVCSAIMSKGFPFQKSFFNFSFSVNALRWNLDRKNLSQSLCSNLNIFRDVCINVQETFSLVFTRYVRVFFLF